jgi:hypothetical protein
MGQLPSPSSANHRHVKSVLSDKYILGEELGRGAYGQVPALPEDLTPQTYPSYKESILVEILLTNA